MVNYYKTKNKNHWENPVNKYISPQEKIRREKLYLKQKEKCRKFYADVKAGKLKPENENIKFLIVDRFHKEAMHHADVMINSSILGKDVND